MLRSTLGFGLRDFAVQSQSNWKIFRPVSHVHVRRLSSASLFRESRSYSTHKQGWEYETTPLPRAHDVLENPNIQLPQHARFTILNPDNIVRKPDELHLHYVAIGTNKHNQAPYRTPKELVVMTPERVATHHVGATIATEVRYEDELEFTSICGSLQKSIQEIVRERAARFHEMQHECEAIANDLARKHRRTDVDDDPLVKHFLAIKSAVKSRQSILNWNEDMIARIATEILQDDLLRDRINFDIHNLVADHIMSEIQARKLTALENFESDREQILLLPQFASGDRLTKIVSGGIATGKSSITKRFAAQLKEKYGTSIHDFAKISTDTFRLLLLQDRNIGSNADIRSAVTQDESRLMFELAVQLIDRKLEQYGYAPHVFIEAISPTEAEIAVGTKLQGALQIDVTHFPDERDAVRGNYKRYLETNERLPPVSAVLGSQQLISSAAPTLFKAHRGKDIVMTLHNTYKIIHGASDRHEIIAHFSFKEDKMYIFDAKEMLNFVKKTYINPSARCEKSVYPEEEKVSTQAMSQCFFDHYKDKEIFFIDPEVHVEQFHESAKHAYAFYHPSRGLVIRDQKLFTKMMESDQNTRTLFNELDRLHGHNVTKQVSKHH